MRWYLAVALLLAVALTLGMGLLAYAMYVLLGVLVLSRYLAREWIENLSATRECNRLSAEIGEKIAVVVTIKNSGRLPVPWVLVEDVLPRRRVAQGPPPISLEGRRLKLAMLRPRGRTILFYQLEFNTRGYYQIGPLVMESGDVFGLHRRYRAAAEPHFVLVYPRIVPVPGYDLASPRPIGELRLTHRLFEDPTRIAGVRAYEPGDPLSRVHWRATARTGSLHSKVYEPSCVAGATVLLDFYESAYPASNEPVRSELAVTTAASLANAVYQTGQQVGFATNGRDAADRIRQEGPRHDFRTRSAAQQGVAMRERSERLEPLVVETRRGAEQLMRIVETLARVELSDGLAFDAFVIEVASRLPRDATVIAVLPDADESTAIALGNLRRQGYAVSAILIQFDTWGFQEAAGRLLAQGIEARQVIDEESLSMLCGRPLVH